MRLPRGLSGADLVKALHLVGDEPARQVGSHVRVTTTVGGEHHVTIPQHRELRLGTLAGILGDVAEHLELSRDQLLERSFGKSA